MRLKGRYVPDSIFEMPMGNGVTQLVYEPIKTFSWEKPKYVEAVTVEEKPKKNNRQWIRGSIFVAAFLLGASFGAIIQEIYYAVPLFVSSLAWIALVAWVNRKE